jgi:hypothetical protein
VDRKSLTALRLVSDIPLLVGLGFTLYGAAAWLAVAKGGVMPIDLARLLAVQRHLEAGLGPTGGVAAFGSSVVVEGVDCAVVRTRLRPGIPCQNLAWTGADVSQWLLIRPALGESPPAVVLLGVDVHTLLAPAPIPAERLVVAGWWRFAQGHDLQDLIEVLGADERAVLVAPRITQLLRFRSFPPAALNEYLREAARSDLRYEGYLENFDAPWIRRAHASPGAMQKHLARMTAEMRVGGVGRLGVSERPLEAFVRGVRHRRPDTEIVLVLTPVHPALAATLAPGTLDTIRRFLAGEAEHLDARFLDHSLALGVEEFSDAQHPSGDGRRAWSLKLGEQVGSLLQ